MQKWFSEVYMGNPGRYESNGLPMIGVVAAILGLVFAATTEAKVVTYPAPAGETVSSDYEIQAGGQKVDAYMARVLDPPFAGKQWDYGGDYSFASFDMSGPVEVRIVSKQSLKNVVNVWNSTYAKR